MIGIHVRGHDRAEDLLAQAAIPGVLCFDQRRLDEVPLVAGRRSSRDNLRVPLRVVQVSADLREGLLVDHRAHEVAEVGHVADLDLMHHRGRAVPDVVPQRPGHVDAAGGGTLLPLVFEPAARDRDSDFHRIRRWVHDDEVLAAGFTDQARIGAIAADVFADLLPHPVEDFRAAGEVHAGEL